MLKKKITNIAYDPIWAAYYITFDWAYQSGSFNKQFAPANNIITKPIKRDIPLTKEEIDLLGKAK